MSWQIFSNMVWQIANALSVWLVVLVMVGWIPALGWWLTDGFKGWHRLPPSKIGYQNVPNPRTNRTIIAPVDERTGFPVAWPD